MDEFYMERALQLAKLGRGKVNPNPMVGAVIVKNNKIIGEGYHMEYGKAHAEVNAFSSITESADGACLYVTLEPCSHYGKTPPCVEKVINSGVKRVVIGSMDPNPLVAGRGINKLIESGIEVKVGVLEEQCKKLNKVFMKYITKNLPYVVLKAGMTLDGKIATVTGKSKWITSEASRMEGQKLRNELSAIMVGVNTVLADDPKLTCRIEGGKNPRRIIVDTSLRITLGSKVVTDEYKNSTIIATTEKADKDKLKELINRGVKIITTPVRNERVDLPYLMQRLAEEKIDSVLLEGGAELNFSALSEGIVDEVNLFIAPKIMGGINAKSAIAGSGISDLKDCFNIDNLEVSMIADDICVKGMVRGKLAICLPE